MMLSHDVILKDGVFKFIICFLYLLQLIVVCIFITETECVLRLLLNEGENVDQINNSSNLKTTLTNLAIIVI